MGAIVKVLKGIGLWFLHSVFWMIGGAILSLPTTVYGFAILTGPFLSLYLQHRLTSEDGPESEKQRTLETEERVGPYGLPVPRANEIDRRIEEELPRSLPDFLVSENELTAAEREYAKKKIRDVREIRLKKKLQDVEPTSWDAFEEHWPNPTDEEEKKIEKHIKVNKKKEQRRNRLSDLTEQAKKASLIDLEKQIRAVYGEVDSPFGSGSLIVGFCVKEHDLAKEEARHRIASAMRDEWLSEKGATLLKKFAEQNLDWLGEVSDSTFSPPRGRRRAKEGWRKRRDGRGNLSYSSPQGGASPRDVGDGDDATSVPDNAECRFRNLRDALDRADCTVPSDEALLWLLKSECQQLKREQFRRAITDENPETLGDFIRALLDRYGQNWGDYLDWFSEVLEENGIEVDEAEIRQKKEEIERQRELDRFEEQLLSGEGAGARIQELDAMSGEAFEEYLEGLFSKMGYTVERTDLVGDQGADLIVSRFGERIVVQAKRYAIERTVGNRAVQQVVAAVGHYDADRGIVVTTASFSSSAEALAESNDVELWDREQLAELLREYP